MSSSEADSEDPDPSLFSSGFSQIPSNPSFRNSAVNAVAVIPLLSSNYSKDDKEVATTHSCRSFELLLDALRRHNNNNSMAQNSASNAEDEEENEEELLLVVPNSSLTRPGDWRYNETPLKGFHWQHGCQRMRIFDGRPECSRMAHDRLINSSRITRDWIDLCPHRRTAAVIGVLNMRDCTSLQDLHRAEEELHQWAQSRYATPPYEVTAHGRDVERDTPVERLFVFDSFDEECQKNVDLQKSNMGNSILAFPPIDEEHSQMLDLHLNVVVNDLAVAVFRNLETKIQESDSLCTNLNEISAQQQQEGASQSVTLSSARRSISRIMSGGTASTGDATGGSGMSSEGPVSASSRLSLSNMATLVSPESKLAKESPKNQAGDESPAESTSSSTVSQAQKTRQGSFTSATSAASGPSSMSSLSSTPTLITPLDSYWDNSALSSRDIDALRRRDIARREKWAADLSLLAGSPLDAYERYLKAAEMCKSGSPDPLWYAFALEGCAAAHIAMAEAGGYGVDEYLENNFQMPDEIMALAKTKTKDNSAAAVKQTLPEVVFTLCEEAMSITNRHEKLGALHAELLMKLAWYVSESAEAHLRCRWGEGRGCYVGEVGDIPRWEKTSVSKLKFADLKTKDGTGDMIAINSYNRAKQVCELLHEAVSVGCIDPASRVDVASRCARLCLKGVKATQWQGHERVRIRLPRKAAFFVVVAAETMLATARNDKEQSSRDLWLLASQLYTKNSNPPDHGGDYGWAALRGITLNAISILGQNATSHQAGEELLSLLSEISPKIPADVLTSGKSGSASEARHKSATGADGGDKGTRGVTGDNETNVASTASTFARQLRDSITAISSNSAILTAESKWASSDAVKPVQVPMGQSATAFSSVQTMGCVWKAIEYEKCSLAQTKCIKRISQLRRALPTISDAVQDTSDSTVSSLPIYISSAVSIQEEAALELEKVKLQVKKALDEKDAMATFFNPYAKSGKVKMAVVAEGEERAMSVDFGNRLAVPLTVQRCQLEFDTEVVGRIKATPLSFTIPPKSKSFTVHFPFSILPPKESPGEDTDDIVFEVKGINLTLLGRVFFLPIYVEERKPKRSYRETCLVPRPACLYPHKIKEKAADELPEKLRFEACPSQPRLQVYLARTGAPVDSERPVPVSLADGELFTMPSLSLRNYPGPSNHGKLTHLQIFAVDLPGIPDKILYDSAASDKIDDEDVALRMIEEENPPPLRAKALVSSLNLSEINDIAGDGSIIRFQIAAAWNMKQRLPQGTTIRIRFRYRGSSISSAEFWRKREISFQINAITGPRISSMDFRPDLLASSAYVDMCTSLSSRTVDKSASTEAKEKFLVDYNDGTDDRGYSRKLKRVGLDQGTHVASSEVVFVLTIANETSSEVILSREEGPVGGFPGQAMANVPVHPGVSAKFPVVVSRIPRLQSDGSVVNLVDEITSRMKLRWEAKREAEDPSGKQDMAKGHLRIPREALRDIIENYPSFVSRICEPPCDIKLMVRGKPSSSSPLAVSIADPVEVSAEVSVSDWVPAETAAKCSLMLEFFCSRKTPSGTSTGAQANGQSVSREYVWCGKLRREFRMDGEGDDAPRHTIKVAFLKNGFYSVSVCARIRHDDAPRKELEEIWWAPVAGAIYVDKATGPSQ